MTVAALTERVFVALLLPADTYRDAFLQFMEQGMNYAEALSQFNEDEFARAAMGEVFRGAAGIDLQPPYEYITKDARRAPALWQLWTRAQFELSNGVDGEAFQQAMELWQAGWTSEQPHRPTGGFWGRVQVMSWYWRRPPRRAAKPGRRYLSTNQAYNALRREGNG